MKMAAKGLHIVAELFGCPVEKISNIESIKKILNSAIKESGLVKLDEAYHQFQPAGATGFILLETSHISVHTWPEDGYAAVDMFTCGSPEKGRKAVDKCEQLFEAKKITKKELRRG